MDVSMTPKERLKKLFDQGANIPVDNNVPIQRYFRSGQELIRMASVYFNEKQYERAYILLAKFITLFLEKLKSHSQYRLATAQARSANKHSLKVALSQAEKIKSILEEQYLLEYVKWKKEQEKLRLMEEERDEQEKLKEQHRKDLEAKVMLAKEKKQMDYFEEQQRRKQLEQERLELEAEYKRSAESKIQEVASLIPVDFAPPPNLNHIGQNSNTVTECCSEPADPSVFQPVVARSSKPLDLKNTTPSVHKNKYGMRTVTCPNGLPEMFMRYAKSNTDQNVETCGVLFGKLSHDQFIITHVLLPHQTGTSESCTTTREEDLWEFQESCNGICLGWIHTHPSQTAFLSSVDLHTHYPYQCLMAESVAIVCSAKFRETGYFMISPGRGMNEIGICSKVGHHPHSTVPPLYERCDHVYISDSHSAEVVDWRCK